MDIKVTNVATNESVDGIILPATEKDLPLNQEGWNFSWKQFYKKDVMFYKAVLKETPDIIEGLIMISVIDNKMVYMNNIEVAPHNYGSNGKYKNVAGCLIAYACFLSFKYGKGNYEGYLTFDSKTKLINLYQAKYGAVLVGRQKMYIGEINSKKLVKQYLDFEL